MPERRKQGRHTHRQRKRHTHTHRFMALCVFSRLKRKASPGMYARWGEDVVEVRMLAVL